MIGVSFFEKQGKQNTIQQYYKRMVFLRELSKMDWHMDMNNYQSKYVIGTML